MIYIITEKQDTASRREGYQIEANNLSAAKTVASKRQVFKGTVLTIEDGIGNLIATKINGEWK